MRAEIEGTWMLIPQWIGVHPDPHGDANIMAVSILGFCILYTWIDAHDVDSSSCYRSEPSCVSERINAGASDQIASVG